VFCIFIATVISK